MAVLLAAAALTALAAAVALRRRQATARRRHTADVNRLYRQLRETGVDTVWNPPPHPDVPPPVGLAAWVRGFTGRRR